jgi:dTMP kinase
MGGLFITFEGVEGSGKTTQHRLLAETLQRDGHAVIVTREPGGTAAGEAIRKILLTPHDPDLSPRTELLLYLAARAQHVTEILRPALDRGAFVLCDRFTDATLAYQGSGRGLPLPELERLCAWAADGLTPHRTFLLDLDPATGLQRAQARNSHLVSGEVRFELETLAFHQRVRAGYLDLALREPERIRVLDAALDAETLHAQIWQEIRTLPATR